MVLPFDHLGKGGHPLELQNPVCQREGVVQHCIDTVCPYGYLGKQGARWTRHQEYRCAPNIMIGMYVFITVVAITS